MTTIPQPNDLEKGYTATWDAWNRLVKLTDTGGTVAEYEYDGLNRRITKTVASTVRHFYYSDQWQVLEERIDSVTTADRQFVWGLRYVDDLVLRDKGSERLYALQDANWNVVAMADDTGTVKERFAYQPYGESKELNPNFTTYTGTNYQWNYRFTGRELDLETGLQLNRNRYYHQQLGRWINRDPIGYDGGGNLYEYVGGMPVDGADPEGLKAVGSLRVWKFGQLFGSSLTNSEMILHWLPPEDWQPSGEMCKCQQVRLYQIASTTKLWSIRNDTSQQPWHYDNLRAGAQVHDWPNTTYSYARVRDTPGFDPFFSASLRGSFIGLRQSFETCAVCNDGSSPQDREVFGCIHWGHFIDYKSVRVPKPWVKIYLLGPPIIKVDHQHASARTGTDVDRQPISFSQLPPKTGVKPTNSFLTQLKPILGNNLRW